MTSTAAGVWLQPLYACSRVTSPINVTVTIGILSRSHCRFNNHGMLRSLPFLFLLRVGSCVVGEYGAAAI